ncbi:MAG TPA: DUF3240 family protein [Candidatus Desulfobacillus sp.]|nr:DUF3240 family protein [Candidatus Desulfobacillus sp.]
MNMHLTACLRLILPKSLESRALEHLLLHPERVGPFTLYRVEGHGAPHRMTSASEQVRGYADRLQIEILLDEGYAQELIGRLRAELPSSEVNWWLSPVIASGSLA